MPRVARIVVLPLLALPLLGLTQAMAQVLEEPVITRPARVLVLPLKHGAPGAPRLTRDFSLWGGSHHVGGVILDMRSALALRDPERGNHYEFGLRLPVLADQVTRLTMFATAHYTDRTRMPDNKTLAPRPELTPSQSRELGFVTAPPRPGHASVAIGASVQHKVNRSWAVDGSVGAFQVESSGNARTPAPKTKVQPLLRGSATMSF